MESKRVLVGVDFRGARTVVALVTSTGEIIARQVVRDYSQKSEDAILIEIGRSVSVLLEQQEISCDRVDGIGIGSAGHLNFAKGEIISNSNLPGFKNYPFRERFRRLHPQFSSTPIVLDNDANAQAYGEYRFANRSENMAFVTVGAGIGAGLILNGRIFRGSTGSAGELGHMIVVSEGGRKCGCGNHGCLMAHASGLALPGIIRDKLPTWADRLGKEAFGGWNSMADEELNEDAVKIGLEQGNPFCREIVMEFADYLAVGLQNLFQLINPGEIVLGGVLTNWGEEYLSRIRKTFYSLAGGMMREPVDISFSSLKGSAAILGAASLLLGLRAEAA